MKLSEFELIDDLTVDNKVYKRGTKCPESEVPRLLRHNRNYLKLEYEAGIPVLSDAQKKKYQIGNLFDGPKPIMKIKPKPFTRENLTVKWNKLGTKEFKEWAEKQFGEDNIDKRNSARNIIYDILVEQEKGENNVYL